MELVLCDFAYFSDFDITSYCSNNNHTASEIISPYISLNIPRYKNISRRSFRLQWAPYSMKRFFKNTDEVRYERHVKCEHWT
jgi:hypothetical protein